MTTTQLEKGNEILRNLKTHKQVLEALKSASHISIGITDTLGDSRRVTRLTSWNEIPRFTDGLSFGMESDFLDNPKIREACQAFKAAMIEAFQEEIERIHQEFVQL